VICADVLEGLATLRSASVQTVVTSPPYWGLRDYGNAGQLGLEPTPEAYVERMVEVFRAVRRVLRDDGTVWLNLGDSYGGEAGNTRGEGAGGGKARGEQVFGAAIGGKAKAGTRSKDLVGIPWRVAFALQADGWYLRSDIIWAKPNPMPESVTDRPTKSHEYVFLLSKSARYFWDADAVREPHMFPSQSRTMPHLGQRDATQPGNTLQLRPDHTPENHPAGRNIRSVWNIATEPFPGAHFATFPKKLVEPCVKAGTSERGCCDKCGAPWARVVVGDPSEPQRENYHGQGVVPVHRGGGDRPGGYYPERKTVGWGPSCEHDAGDRVGQQPPSPSAPGLDSGPDGFGHERRPVPCIVLDPFCGSGTVGLVAARLGRSFVGIELNPEYAEMARNRIRDDGPLFNVESEVVA
jgi:DNA modification methylase